MKITPSIIIAAIVATVGGAAFISVPTDKGTENAEYRTGYTRNNPNAPEVDLQKTIIREDKTKFTVAQHLVQINKNNVIISTPDEKCTKLECEREPAPICTTEKICTPQEDLCETPFEEGIPAEIPVEEKCTPQPDICEDVETCIPVEITAECQIQFDCEDENLRKAEQRISLNEQNEELYLELLSAKKELELDIPSNKNPYLLK